MKHKYIESLLSEIQHLESKVQNLKKNQNVPFSFFKESFKRTQEITLLLHELEFVQIEDLKGQMEKLVQFLYESENSKEEEKTIPSDSDRIAEVKMSADNEDMPLKPISIVETHTDSSMEIVEKAEDKALSMEGLSKGIIPESTRGATAALTPIYEITHPTGTSLSNNQKEPIINLHSPKNQSLNDIQQANHTFLDTKRSISLNDRFLFQRELFDNNRIAMNDMLTKLQSFTSFDAIDGYLRENTNWNFKDETVDKFIQMLKESFK